MDPKVSSLNCIQNTHTYSSLYIVGRREIKAIEAGMIILIG
jgi:hypothetical protein